MAAATSRVGSTVTKWGDSKIKRGAESGAAQIFYPGAMVCLNAAGYAVKAADAAGLRFDGIVSDSNRVEVLTTDADGDKVVNVEKPWLLTMKIASAAITDVGRKVYVVYDNEVGFTSTHSILVGVVEAYVNATTVLVRPYWTSTSGVNAFDGEALTFTGATGANEIIVPDNLADGLSIKEGSTAYLTFVTTDSAERILVSKQTKLADSVKLAFGDADDITVAWDGTDLDILQATANSSIKWGIDGAGIDQVWYGDTASTSMTWDQSADSLIFTGVAPITFTGTTGQPSILLTDNLADALSIAIPSGNDLLVFKTTNSAEQLIVPNNFGVGSNATDRALIKGIYMNPSVVAVAVPTIADAETDTVAVDVSSAFAIQPAVGDAVIAIPAEALPTDCLLAGAYVTATDTISITFTTKEGGSGVTGANKNFSFLVIDLT